MDDFLQALGIAAIVGLSVFCILGAVFGFNASYATEALNGRADELESRLDDLEDRITPPQS